MTALSVRSVRHPQPSSTHNTTVRRASGAPASIVHFQAETDPVTLTIILGSAQHNLYSSGLTASLTL